MTDPTTTPTPPQGLTDAQLLELAEKELCIDDMRDVIAAMRAAIAAHEAARPQPTPPPRSPMELTDKQLLELADGEIEADDVLPMDEYEAANDRALEVYRSELIAVMHAAIAADRAGRAQLRPNYIDPEHTGEDRKLLEVFYLACEAEGGTADEIVLRGLRAAIAADRAARPQLTPEEVEARFRSWWGECYPNVPAGRHTVRSHVAFALHLLGGEGAA